MAGLSTDDAHFAGLAEAKKDETILSQKHAIMETSSEEELDGIHDGLEFPTEEEKETLRRVPDKLPLNAYCKYPS
jgi:proton-dependent oligopeptide transporter, POT family